jgi:hypothetical protein
VEQQPANGQDSFLYQPAYKLDRELRYPVQPYQVQPGDIVLVASDKLQAVLGFALAGSWYPNHALIVFARCNGSLAVLETGLHGKLTKGQTTSDLMPILRELEQAGRVWIRERKTPLTPEQSARLTEFACKVEGRPTSFVKLYGQITPFRSRMPLRTAFMGQPNPEKRGFYCSELIVEACSYAGLVNSELARPAATYPRDLFFDHSTNVFLNRSLVDFAGGWQPPARWTSGNQNLPEKSCAPLQPGQPR